MISFEELVDNDDFIKWVSNKPCVKALHWINLQNTLEGKELEDFERAILTVETLLKVDINKGFKIPKEEQIELGLSRLHEASESLILKTTSYRYLEIFKYAAAIIVFIGISIFSYQRFTSHNNLFEGQLAEVKYSSDKLLMETEKGKFYELPRRNKTWTLDGVKLTLTNKNLSFVNTKEEDIIEDDAYKLHIPYRENYEIHLLDGTEVKLNANSTLSFNLNTKSQNREVALKGEGYFNVTHNKHRPFIVKTEKMDIEVLGTVFNVAAYTNEKTVETTLIHGSVRVNNKIKEGSQVIKPGDVAIIDKNVGEIRVEKANLNGTMLWVSEVMTLNNNRLEDICNQLGRWYGVYFEFSPGDIQDIRYSGELRKDMELESILKKIQYLEGIEYTINNKTVHMSKN